MCTAVRRYRGQMLRSNFLSQWGFPLGGKMSLVRDEALAVKLSLISLGGAETR